MTNLASLGARPEGTLHTWRMTNQCYFPILKVTLIRHSSFFIRHSSFYSTVRRTVSPSSRLSSRRIRRCSVGRESSTCPLPATAQADFSKFTYDELNHAVQRLAQRGIRGGFSPVVDGTILPQHPFEPAAPTAKDVPMLIGTDFNEFTFDISRTMTWPEAEATVRQRQGERAEAFVAAFKKAYPKAEPKEMTYVDTGFRAGAVKQAAAKAPQGESRQPTSTCSPGSPRAMPSAHPTAWSCPSCSTTSVCSAR
ncbi:MAG: carboxylesterase family protein [Bacteroidaceae bacterium]|nr:carboxylesterase family protein [Bacteroidaceae bacterium]